MDVCTVQPKRDPGTAPEGEFYKICYALPLLNLLLSFMVKYITRDILHYVLGVTKGSWAPSPLSPSWPMEVHFFPALSLLQHLSIGLAHHGASLFSFPLVMMPCTPVSALTPALPVLIPSAVSLILGSLSQALKSLTS